MAKYEDIPSGADEEAPTSTPRSDDALRRKVSIRVIIGGVAALSMVLVLIMSRTSSATSSTPSLKSFFPLALGKKAALKKAGKTPCTFDECYASNCNQKVAPYTCLFHNGGPHGGCSPTPWIEEGTCTTSCDLTGCADLDIPKDAKSCDVPCDKKVCVGERLCDHDAPYQCTSGSANFGCSEGKMEWTLKTNVNTCSSCCNAATCKESE